MFNEMQLFDALIERAQKNPNIHSDVHTVATINWNNLHFPINILELGNPSHDTPCIGFFSGVHGLERIGTQVILAFLQSITERLYWDESLKHQLGRTKLVFMPIVNPIGIFRQTRCNANNIDLMRNAPIDAEVRVPFLVGGHRISPRLPWYRGKRNKPMEQEAQALVNTVNDFVLPHRKSITIDCHSGFGVFDRLWFPYAYTDRPFHHLSEVMALKNQLDNTYPYHHFYQMEPQSNAYKTHGDLWDYLSTTNSTKDFLPLTLEMGSWLWLKKNPRQIFDTSGAYHPVQEHRIKRVLRQHIPLLDFLIRSTTSYSSWWPERASHKRVLWNEAINLWHRC